MNDSIYTIPISEVFEPKDGCPICRMRNTLEKRCVEYITGAAMMEPDIRIKTNEKGFCKTHFDMLFKRQNKLSLALQLSTIYSENLLDNIKVVSDKKRAKKQVEYIEKFEKTCVVCELLVKSRNVKNVSRR
jgi:hypothetical protein